MAEEFVKQIWTINSPLASLTILYKIKSRRTNKKKVGSNIKFHTIFQYFTLYIYIYRFIRNDCRGFKNLSYTIHLK